MDHRKPAIAGAPDRTLTRSVSKIRVFPACSHHEIAARSGCRSPAAPCAKSSIVAILSSRAFLMGPGLKYRTEVACTSVQTFLDVAAQTESLSTRLAELAFGYGLAHLRDMQKGAAR